MSFHMQNGFKELFKGKIYVLEGSSQRKLFLRACHAQNGFGGVVTEKWFQRSYHKENGFRWIVTAKMLLEGLTHTKSVRGLVTRKTVLEGDHRNFSNIQTKISRHTIYFGDVYCAANPSQFQ